MQRRIFRAFLGALGGVALWLGIQWYQVCYGHVPETCVFAAPFLANYIFFRLRPGMPTKAADQIWPSKPEN